MELKDVYKPDISKVIDFLRDRGYLPGITRSIYDYDMEHSLKLVEAIGKMRSSRFVIDDLNRFAYENFIKWLHCDDTMQSLNPLSGDIVRGSMIKGIYIAGGTGTGKSWCLDIMRSYATIYGFDVEVGGETKKLEWRTMRSDEIYGEYAKEGQIRAIKAQSILGIQDLGQEPKEALYMGNRMNVLQQLLEYRGDRTDAITLITSNLRISSDTLRDSYGDRVQSRLVEMCNYLEIRGKDRRKLI